MYVRWEKPRRWTVRASEKHDRGYMTTTTYGVVAYSVAEAIEGFQKLKPLARIDSVNDTGSVDLVVGDALTQCVLPKGETHE